MCGEILGKHYLDGWQDDNSEIVGGEAACGGGDCFVIAAGRGLLGQAIGCCVVVGRGLNCKLIVCLALLSLMIESVVVIGRIVECVFHDVGALLGGAMLDGCVVDG